MNGASAIEAISAGSRACRVNEARPEQNSAGNAFAALLRGTADAASLASDLSDSVPAKESSGGRGSDKTQSTGCPQTKKTEKTEKTASDQTEKASDKGTDAEDEKTVQTEVESETSILVSILNGSIADGTAIQDADLSATFADAKSSVSLPAAAGLQGTSGENGQNPALSTVNAESAGVSPADASGAAGDKKTEFSSAADFRVLRSDSQQGAEVTGQEAPAEAVTANDAVTAAGGLPRTARDESSVGEAPVSSENRAGARAGQGSRGTGTADLDEAAAAGTAGQNGDMHLTPPGASAKMSGKISGENTREDPGVMEETRTLATTPETAAADLAELLAAREPFRKDGKLSIELTPQNLGRITIEVSVTGNRAAVAIAASEPATLQMLTQNADEMAKILQKNTGQQTEIFIAPKAEEQQQAGTADSESSNRQSAEEQKERAEQTAQRGAGDEEAFLHRMRLGLA